MKGILLLIIGTLLFNILHSQQTGNDVWYITQNDTSNKILTISTEGFYASSIFNNKFTDKLINGGFIDNNLKGDALKRADKKDKAGELNYLGGEWNTRILFSNTTDTIFGNWGYYIGASYNYQLGTQFTSDAYKLIFYGNKSFEGTDVNFLGRTAFSLRDYNRFLIGINKQNRTKIGIALLSYNNRMFAEIENGSITVDTLGTAINVEMVGEYSSVDTSKSTGFFSNNAMGIGIDFEYTFQINKTPHSPRINIGVNNLGMVHQKDAYVVATRANYQYKGVEITSLSDLSENLIAPQAIEDSLGVVKGHLTRWAMLPFLVYFYQVPSYQKTIEPIYGFQYRNSGLPKPFFYFGGNLNVKQKYNINSYISYGGFANFQWGIGLQAHLKKINLGLNTNNVLGFITTESYGKSIGISFSYQL